MSKVNITGRSNREDHMQPRMQNIPLRTDLGAKLRKILRDQEPDASRTSALHSIDFSGLEMKLHAEYSERFINDVKVKKP